jgi:hypothetical protein
MVAVALVMNLKLPTPLASESFLSVAFYPEQATITYSTHNVWVVGNDRSAFAAGDVFDAVETEANDVACAPYVITLVLRSERVGGVLDDAQSSNPRELVDCIEVAGIASVVHGHDGSSALSATLRGVLQIDRE